MSQPFRKRIKRSSSTEAHAISSTPNMSAPNCVICLDLISPNNKCLTSCFHEFCYDCISEWLKYKNQCPLCKRPLEYLIHDVKSPTTYKLTSIDDGYSNESESRVDTSSPLPFIHTTKMWSLFGYDSASIGLFVERNCLYDNQIPERTSVLEWRSFCYEKNLWAVSFDPPVMAPHQSLDFYRQNSGSLQALRIWLVREMYALAYVVAAKVTPRQIERVMRGVAQCNIDSEEFRDFLPPLERKTNHFVHELISFASSMHNSSVEEYDANVKYDFRTPRNTWSDTSSDEGSQTSTCTSSGQSDINDYNRTEIDDNSDSDSN